MGTSAFGSLVLARALCFQDQELLTFILTGSKWCVPMNGGHNVIS